MYSTDAVNWTRWSVYGSSYAVPNIMWDGEHYIIWRHRGESSTPSSFPCKYATTVGGALTNIPMGDAASLPYGMMLYTLACTDIKNS